MDSKYLIACGFLGKYRVNQRLRAFQFGYVSNSNDEQLMLPCPQAFSLQGRDNWILTHDEVRDIIAKLQPDTEVEDEDEEEEEEQQHEQEQEQYNATWEGQQQQQHQLEGDAWGTWPNQPPPQQQGYDYVPYN